MQEEILTKDFHGVTVFNCVKCKQLKPIDVRLPKGYNSKEWENLFQKIQEQKIICRECKNAPSV